MYCILFFLSRSCMVYLQYVVCDLEIVHFVIFLKSEWKSPYWLTLFPQSRLMHKLALSTISQSQLSSLLSVSISQSEWSILLTSSASNWDAGYLSHCNTIIGKTSLVICLVISLSLGWRKDHLTPTSIQTIHHNVQRKHCLYCDQHIVTCNHSCDGNFSRYNV